MTPLSDSEAATVARFENAGPAPESWGGGLREALESEVFAGVLRQIAADSDLHSTMYANLDPRPIVRDLLALPELAALRAKADAADRVRAVIDRHADNLSPTQRAAFARAFTGSAPC